jgi:hypothetical protein
VGNKTYWPGGNIYTLTNLEPGKGYLANFLQEVTITFPPMSHLIAPNQKSTPPAPGPWHIARTGSVHLISIAAEAIYQLENDDYIGAFNSDGICVGFADISGATENILLTVYGDDLLTDEKDGLEAGESISLRAFSYSLNEETPLQAEWNKAFVNADGLFASEGLSQITAFKAGAIGGSESNNLAQVQVYPNPAKDVLNINLTGLDPARAGLTGLAATLLTADGRPVRTFNLTGEKTTLDITDLQPGIYLLKISAPNRIIMKKLIIR